MSGCEFVPAWPLSDLQPADYNPRRITPGAFEKLQDSLRRFGVVKPVILNRDGTIVAGHQRTKALKAIGAQVVPAIILPVKANRQDEIRFNLMHNSVETDSTEGRVTGDLPFGYSMVDWRRITTEGSRAGGGAVVKESAKLISRYGGWGSVVVAEDGTIIANCDYALAARSTRTPLLVYRMRDSEVPAFVTALGVDYGEYYFEPLGVKGYNQMHAQPNRLRGVRDEQGDLLPHSTDLASKVYRFMVEPHLAGLLPDKPRIVDFGAGHGDHAKNLRSRGYRVLTYEPHLRLPGKEALDVRGIVASVRDLGRDVAREGLFPVVVLDSVLNSVIGPKFEEAVLVTVNALTARGGVCFTNARSLEAAEQLAKVKHDSSTVRRIEFLDEHNFSATFRDGKWTLQHFHRRQEFLDLCGRYFGNVVLTGSDNYHRVALRDPLPMGEERYRSALNIELNMELPGGRYHNRHEHAREAIVEAAVSRDRESAR